MKALKMYRRFGFASLEWLAVFNDLAGRLLFLQCHVYCAYFIGNDKKRQEKT